jgi:hypothetical protein
MSDRVIAAWLLALILAAGAVSAQAAEPATKAEPDPAAQIPEDVALFITAQNIPHLFAGVSQGLLAAGTEETRAAGNFLKDLAQIIAGRAAMAIVFEGNDPQFFLRARVDETKRKVRDVVAAQFDVILGKGNYKLVSKGPLHEIQMADGDSIFWWTVRDGVVTLSEIRGHVDRVITPPPKPVRTLAEVDGYKRLAKHVDWHAGLAVYADIHRFPGQGTGRRRPVGVYRPGGFVEPWLRLADFRYAGLSLASEGQTSSGRIAVLAPKQRVGLAKVLDVPNEPLRHAGRIPEDAHLLVALASGGDDLVGRLAAVMKELDPDIEKEFREELAAFDKELGVDLGKDLVDNLRAITVGVRLPAAGPLAVYSAIGLRDADTFQKAVDALAAYNKTPLRKVERNERTYRLFPTKPKTGYTIHEKTIHYSQSFDAIESMIATKQGGPSLAESDTFKALRKKLPAEHVLLAAADAQFLARWAQTLLAMGARDMPISITAASKLLGRFQQGKPGLSLGLAVRNEPDAFVVHIECIAGDLWGAMGGLGAVFKNAEE